MRTIRREPWSKSNRRHHGRESTCSQNKIIPLATRSSGLKISSRHLNVPIAIIGGPIIMNCMASSVVGKSSGRKLRQFVFTKCPRCVLSVVAYPSSSHISLPRDPEPLGIQVPAVHSRHARQLGVEYRRCAISLRKPSHA